jgi:hypothetical protein
MQNEPSDATSARYRLMSATDSLAGFLDEPSVQRTNNIRDYWVLVVWSKPVTMGAKQYDFAKYRYQLDCSGWTVRTSYAVFYDKAAQPSMSQLSGSPMPIVPATNAESIANYLCKGHLEAGTENDPLLPEALAIQAARDVLRRSANPTH